MLNLTCRWESRRLKSINFWITKISTRSILITVPDLIIVGLEWFLELVSIFDCVLIFSAMLIPWRWFNVWVFDNLSADWWGDMDRVTVVLKSSYCQRVLIRHLRWFSHSLDYLSLFLGIVSRHFNIACINGVEKSLLKSLFLLKLSWA